MQKGSTCRYCGCIHLSQRCLEYGKMCGECGRENHFSAVCRAPRWAVYRLEEQENGQTNRVNTDHFIHNSSYIRSSIETKLNTSSFYNSINIMYKLDIGRNNNSIPFHIFKNLFPKAANKGIRWPKTCKVKIKHNEKEKICKFVVAQNCSPAVLGIQDIAKLGLISINYDTMQGKGQKMRI